MINYNTMKRIKHTSFLLFFMDCDNIHLLMTTNRVFKVSYKLNKTLLLKIDVMATLKNNNVLYRSYLGLRNMLFFLSVII